MIRLTLAFIISAAFCFAAIASPQKATKYDKSVSGVFPNEQILENQIFDSSDHSINNMENPIGTMPLAELLDSDLQGSISLDLTQILDVQKFFEINEEIALAWDNYVDQCAKGNRKKATVKYRKSGRCKKEKEELYAVKRKVKQFLLNSNFKSFQYPDQFECKGNNLEDEQSNFACGISVKFDDFSTVLRLGRPYEPSEHVHIYNRHSKALFGAMELPAIHPLFFQFVFEALADGFPLPFAGRVVRGIGIDFLNPLSVVPTDKIVRGPRHWGWGPLGPFTPKLNVKEAEIEAALNRFAYELSVSNEIPSIQRMENLFGEEFGDVDPADLNTTLAKLRLGYAADRLIQIMSYMQPERDTWGLWPQSSRRLMTTFAINHYNPLGNVSPSIISHAKLIADNRFSHVPQGTNKIFGIDMSGEQNDRGYRIMRATSYYLELQVNSTNPSAIEYLSEVGAWRKLWHMQ